MLKNLIRLTLIIVITMLISATAAFSQVIQAKPSEDSAKSSQPTVNAAEDCSQMLIKTLDVLQELKTAKAAVEAELTTNKELRQKEEAYNAELLKAVSLLVSAEKRDKGFFRKLFDQLGKVLKAVTKPENLATVVTLIVLVKKLR